MSFPRRRESRNGSRIKSGMTEINVRMTEEITAWKGKSRVKASSPKFKNKNKGEQSLIIINFRKHVGNLTAVRKAKYLSLECNLKNFY